MKNKEQRLNKLGLKLLKDSGRHKYVVLDKNHGKPHRSFEIMMNPVNFKNQKELESWVVFQEKHGRFDF